MTTTLNPRAIAFLASIIATVGALSPADCQKIRVLSLDVTGTLLATREPVILSYHKAALWAKLPDPPSPEELKAGFKAAYKERCIESPCFGGVEGISGREWWYETVRRVLYKTGREYSREDYDRYFRRVYQHFGSPDGYRVLEDAQIMIDALTKNQESNRIILGITSNTPTRHMESVLPMLNSFHDNFHFFTCSQDVGVEKPEAEIFEKSYQEAKFWIPDLQKDEVLHIGDSYACDYCGAKAYGFQALMLDRSSHSAVIAYQDWVAAPDYPGKALEEVQENTITSLEEVLPLLTMSVNRDVENEREEQSVIKPRVSVMEDGSQQQQIKPRDTKAVRKDEEVEEETEPVETVDEQIPYPPNNGVWVDDLTAKFDERRPRDREEIPSLRFNSLGQLIEDRDKDDESKPEETKPTYVAAVETLGYQVQQQYSTDSWFDAKSKVTASVYSKNTRPANTGKSIGNPVGAGKQPVRASATSSKQTAADSQPKVESALNERQTSDGSTGPSKRDVGPAETQPRSQDNNAATVEGAYYFSNLYSNSNTGSSNQLEDFRDIKSPPIYGTKRTKLTSANKSDAAPSKPETPPPKLDRDIASGQHLSVKYFHDYSTDDFRELQSPPIDGQRRTKSISSASKKDAEPTKIEPSKAETPPPKLDRDIASGQHLSVKYFHDYSTDDFRELQSPPIDGQRRTKPTGSASKKEAEPSKIEPREAETPPPKLDRDISSGQHLSVKYFDGYSYDDFRELQSPPIDGQRRTKSTSANESDADPSETEPLKPKLDRDIASGRHLSNRYFDDYSTDDFRDIQSPPIF